MENYYDRKQYKGFRIFTCSRNFGIQKQPKSKTYFMSRTQANNFIKYCEDKYSKIKVSKNYVRKHCHRHKTEKGLKTFIKIATSR